MAGKGKAVGAMIKYGPILVETSRRYGPKVWDQVKSQREPAERFVQAKVDKGNQRKKAIQHAETVIDGSTLRIFYHNAAHYVVFSGDEPVAVHPRANVSYATLLKNADLAKRIRPEDEPTGLSQRLRRSGRPRSSGTRTTSTPSARSKKQQHAQADVTLRRDATDDTPGIPRPPRGPDPR